MTIEDSTLIIDGDILPPNDGIFVNPRTPVEEHPSYNRRNTPNGSVAGNSNESYDSRQKRIMAYR